MERIELENYIIWVSDERIESKDWYLMNNPHPTSTMKNRVIRCESIHSNDTIQPVSNYLVWTEHKREWCKKIVAHTPKVGVDVLYGVDVID
jgi:hypothetical protein